MVESEPSATLTPGTVLDKYRLSAKLGEGGMGTVFVAVHERLGREVAIKTLKAEFTGTPDVVARFQTEAEAVTRIGHPNIVAVYDFGRLPSGGLYYVMEKVNGETLTARLRRQPLSESDLRDVFTQLLSALAAAHNVSVVHRDLKPDNIVVVQQREGERPLIKLLDFGVAKIRDERRAGPQTTAGALMGTPRYMAPEQVKGAQDVDGRADIYAVGVMLYEALCGRAPFEGKMMQLLMAHVNEVPEPPSVRAGQVGGVARERVQWPLIDAIVLKALAKRPEDRYQDCRSLAVDLEAALAPSIPAATVPAAVVAAPTAAAAPAPRPRAVGFAIAAVISALVIAGASALLVQALRAPAGSRDPAGEAPERPGQPAPQVPAPAAHRGLPAAVAARATQVLDQGLGGSAESRRGALEMIEEVRARRLLPRVIPALADDNPAVRRAAAQAALALGQPGDDALLSALREAAGRSAGAVAAEIAAARLALGEGAAADELLVVARRATDPAVRLRAALALSQAGRAPAAQLRAALVAADQGGALRPALRRAALARLAVLEDPAIRKEIEAALRDPAQADLLLEAAEALARAGDARGRDALLQHAGAAREDQATERTRADPAAALAQAEDPRAVPLLVPLIQDQKATGRTRGRAVAALGFLALRGKWRLDLDLLRPLLDDPQPLVAVAAAVALLGQAEPGG